MTWAKFPVQISVIQLIFELVSGGSWPGMRKQWSFKRICVQSIDMLHLLYIPCTLKFSITSRFHIAPPITCTSLPRRSIYQRKCLVAQMTGKWNESTSYLDSGIPKPVTEVIVACPKSGVDKILFDMVFTPITFKLLQKPKDWYTICLKNLPDTTYLIVPNGGKYTKLRAKDVHCVVNLAKSGIFKTIHHRTLNSKGCFMYWTRTSPYW